MHDAADIDYAAEAEFFISVQLARYLDNRQTRGFSGQAEYDAVLAMIRDAWVEIRFNGGLEEMSRGGREALYWTTLIIFPTFVADSGLDCIPVDFIGRKRVGDQILAAPKRPVTDRSPGLLGQ